MKTPSLKPKTYKLKAIGGFTLIELLVVIAIISLLSSIVLASLGQARSKARDSKRVQDLIQLRNALELYASTNNGLYPPNPNPEPTGLSCWDCLPGTLVRDPDRLLALDNYIKTRPTDPNQPFPSMRPPGESYFPYQIWGYWYKVSEGLRHYKLTILGSVENMANIPSSMSDPNYWGPSYPNTISIYSDNISKNWTIFADVNSP